MDIDNSGRPGRAIYKVCGMRYFIVCRRYLLTNCKFLKIPNPEGFRDYVPEILCILGRRYPPKGPVV
jgi:hypothetical protein